LILGKNLTTTRAKQLGLKDIVSPYFPDDMFDTYKRRKDFSFNLAIFGAIFKKIQFKVKLFLHIFKICQISRACILNLDR
jgi:hypothetical protein